MMRQPGFWHHGGGGMLPGLLSPAAALTAVLTARRLARPGWLAPVPVICCGNATVGGAGKTVVASALASRLGARGLTVHMLTRGFGGAARGLVRVDLDRHRADEVGDEPLLLARIAPTWVSRDRALSAKAAVAAGAGLLIMDDGMQNPTLCKTLSLLVVDGATGFGNGRLLPAGPLREPVAACAARAGAVVMIGEDQTGARGLLPPGLPVLQAHQQPAAGIEAWRGKRAVAFAGIGHPAKFFAMLRQAGVTLLETRAFPDHHRYDDADMRRLIARADALGAVLVTTPKDHVRLGGQAARAVSAVGVSLVWEDEAALDALLARALAGGGGG
jgi:tetraacyldisaccharide 4'-kinase